MALIIGHRGAMGHAPENTLLSFQKAIDFGCKKTELDVRLTKDNVAVVIHDNKINKTTNGRGLVSSLTLSEIKKYNCKQGQEIPTLQEVINLCKNKIDLYIELKTKDAVEIVNKLILKNKIISQVLILSFDVNTIKEVKKTNPKLKVGFSYKGNSKNIWELAESIPLDLISRKYTYLKQSDIDNAHKLNKKIFTFTVNNIKKGKKLIKMGVDEICTDYPEKFI